MKTSKWFIVFDISDLQKQNSLLRLVEDKFFHQTVLLTNQDLSLAGFWFPENRFHLSENFGLAEDGLIFFYHYFEIAHYAFGVTEILLSKKELKYFLLDKNMFHKNENNSNE